MITTTLFCIGVLFVLCYFFVRWRHQYWTRKVVPQFKSHFIFGDTKDIIVEGVSLKDHILDIYRRAKKAGYKHVGIYNTIIHEYVPIDAGLIKRILVKDFVYFGGHGLYHDKRDNLSMHLFNLDGAEWKKRRTELTPVFTTGKLKLMFEAVADKATALNKYVGKFVEINEPINIKETFARYTTDVISSVAFGLECDTLNVPNHKLIIIGREATKSNRMKLILTSIFNFKFLASIGFRKNNKRVESYFTNIVNNTIQYREQNSVQRTDFIQQMLQLKHKAIPACKNGSAKFKKAKASVTDQEIINEAFLFYLAGFETSSSAMTFLLFELARNQDIQDKLREEIRCNLEKYDGKLTYDSLAGMEYLDKVVKETLRKYPVVPSLPRECTKDYKIDTTNVVIQKGTKVHIPVIGLQMDPEYYPNPEEFNPENFNSDNKSKRPDVTWIPFGEGPRQCIGMRLGIMQSKIGVVALLKDYTFTLANSMKLPFEVDNGSPIYSFKKSVMVNVSRA